MKQVDKMSLNELNNFYSILLSIKKRIGEQFATYGVTSFNELDLSEPQKKLLYKHKRLQDYIVSIEKLIETKVFKEYVDKD